MTAGSSHAPQPCSSPCLCLWAFLHVLHAPAVPLACSTADVPPAWTPGDAFAQMPILVSLPALDEASLCSWFFAVLA